MKTKTILFITIFIITINQSFAQENETYIDSSLALNTGMVKGKVVDEKSKYGIPYANIALIVNGKVQGTQTDFDGYFEVKPIPVGTYDLNVSFVGYNEKQIDSLVIDSQEVVHLNISLKEATELLKPFIVKHSCGSFIPISQSSGMTVRFDRMGRVIEQFHGVSR